MATIREYFDTDFSYAAKIHCRIQAGPLSVEAKVLIDFAGYKGFVSCFVPGPHHAIADYVELLKKIDYGQPFGIVGTVTLPAIREFPGELQVKNLPNTVELVARFYGDPSWTPLNEIPTSTRVFIYSESDLEDKDILALKEAGRTLGHQVQFRSPAHAMERSKKEVPLAFISYDSRDREVARRIATQLQRIACPVWYDEYSLAIGDNLRDKIELGTKQCHKCVLVLSQHFFSNRGWTKKEFDSIFTREILEEQSLVLPVWHGVTKQAVFEYSPGLLNVKGIEWEEAKEEEIGRRLHQAIMQQKGNVWGTTSEGLFKG
jgi:hypothetical protein